MHPWSLMMYCTYSQNSNKESSAHARFTHKHEWSKSPITCPSAYSASSRRLTKSDVSSIFTDPNHRQTYLSVHTTNDEPVTSVQRPGLMLILIKHSLWFSWRQVLLDYLELHRLQLAQFDPERQWAGLLWPVLLVVHLVPFEVTCPQSHAPFEVGRAQCVPLLEKKQSRSTLDTGKTWRKGRYQCFTTTTDAFPEHHYRWSGWQPSAELWWSARSRRTSACLTHADPLYDQMTSKQSHSTHSSCWAILAASSGPPPSPRSPAPPPNLERTEEGMVDEPDALACPSRERAAKSANRFWTAWTRLLWCWVTRKLTWVQLSGRARI